MNRHSLATHLPWYIGPFTTCWSCKKQESKSNRLNFHIKEHHTLEEKTRWEEHEYGESWVNLINGLFREIARVMEVAFPDGLVRIVNQFMECHKLTTQFMTMKLS